MRTTGIRSVLPLIGVLLLVACSDESVGPEAVEYAIAVESGADQYGGTDAELAEPLRVVVTNVDTDAPVDSVPVVWEVAEGPMAEVTSPMTLTDSLGVASTRVRLGPEAGEYRITASTNRLFGRAAHFRVRGVNPPVIESLSSKTVTAGDTITVRGERFSTTAEDNVALFDGMRGSVVSGTASELRVQVPPCLPTRTVDVTVQLGPVRSDPAGLDVIGGQRNEVTLQVGEVRRLAGDALRCVSLPAGELGAAFMAVPQNASEFFSAETSFRFLGLTGSGGTQTVGVSRSESPFTLRPRAAGSSTRRLDDWEARLRAREHRIRPGEILGDGEAETRRDGETDGFDASASIQSAVQVGDTREFQVYNKDQEYDTVTAKVVHVSEHAILYEDEDAPGGGFGSQDFERFGGLFDDPIYETVASIYGSPSDVDGNGRVIILFTPVVNALTERNTNGGFIAGFFFGRDLTDQENSNQAEIFYSVVPDPNGEFSDPRSTEKVLTTVPPVLAHEFQHMVHFNQRRRERKASSGEALWLSEALAHMAEDLVADTLLARGDSETGANFKGQNLTRAYYYLGDPGAESLVSTDKPGTLEMRGAAWLFIKYLSEHFGGEVLLRDLTQTTRTGVDNVTTETGTTWEELFHRLTVALWADDPAERGSLPVDPIYTFPDTHLRGEMERWLSVQFPLRPETFAFEDFRLDGTAPASSAAYVLIDAGTSESVPLNMSFTAGLGAAFDTMIDAQLGLIRVD